MDELNALDTLSINDDFLDILTSDTLYTELMSDQSIDMLDSITIEALTDTEIFTAEDIGPADPQIIGASNNISFGASTLSPESWANGVSYSEISHEVIENMSVQMMEMFGRFGVDVHQWNGFENAAMSSGDSANVYLTRTNCGH